MISVHHYSAGMGGHLARGKIRFVGTICKLQFPLWFKEITKVLGSQSTQFPSQLCFTFFSLNDAQVHWAFHASGRTIRILSSLLGQFWVFCSLFNLQGNMSVHNGNVSGVSLFGAVLFRCPTDQLWVSNLPVPEGKIRWLRNSQCFMLHHYYFNDTVPFTNI